MRPHLSYLTYLARHKWFVFVAGLRVGAPLWRLIIHDWSKFTSTEWGPYVRRFFSGRGSVLDKSADPEEFHRAWTHHWHLNPHHWEHWLAIGDGNALQPLRIPEDFVREMVADWAGAGRAITGKWEVAAWYQKNAARILLHPASSTLAEVFLESHFGLAERAA